MKIDVAFRGFCNDCARNCSVCKKRLCQSSRTAKNWVDCCMCASDLYCRKQGCVSCFLECAECARAISASCAVQTFDGQLICKRENCLEKHTLDHADEDDGDDEEYDDAATSIQTV